MGRSQERKCGEISGGSKAISRAPEDCVFDVLIRAWPATCSVPVGSTTPRAGRASQGFSHQQAGPGWGGRLCHPLTSHFRAFVCPSVSSNTQPEGLLGEIMKITPGITPTSKGRLSPVGVLMSDLLFPFCSLLPLGCFLGGSLLLPRGHILLVPTPVWPEDRCMTQV